MFILQYIILLTVQFGQKPKEHSLVDECKVIGSAVLFYNSKEL